MMFSNSMHCKFLTLLIIGSGHILSSLILQLQVLLLLSYHKLVEKDPPSRRLSPASHPSERQPLLADGDGAIN